MARPASKTKKTIQAKLGNLTKPGTKVNQKLTQALAESLASADLRKKFEDSGAVTANATPPLASFQKLEIDKYERIVKFAKIRE